MQWTEPGDPMNQKLSERFPLNISNGEDEAR